MTAKPTVADLGIDPDTQHWQRSGRGPGAIELAFVQAPAPGSPAPAVPGPGVPPSPPAARDSATPSVTKGAPAPSRSADLADWVLMRVTGDADGRVLVFDRHEWECFLDGARKGEFDDAASHDAASHATP